MTNFKPGDIVRLKGGVDEWEVLEPAHTWSCIRHTQSKINVAPGNDSLELVRRAPKRKEKRTIERWVNVYPDGEEGAYLSKEYADRVAGVDRIACVRLVGECEVEVE